MPKAEARSGGEMECAEPEEVEAIPVRDESGEEGEAVEDDEVPNDRGEPLRGVTYY